MENSSQKLSLRAFLQLLTSNDLPISRAMVVAGKIYKEFNTPDYLGQLTDTKLSSLGVTDKDDRKLVLGAITKAGYRAKVAHDAKVEKAKKRKAPTGKSSVKTEVNQEAGPSQVSISTPPAKKRKRQDDVNEFLPDRPAEEIEELGNLDFEELLDEDVLKPKFTVVNRAPIMMAWAFIVAERLGFQREEALSIASVYTEMNAISKGISLGLHPP
ncbi:hypothetical protein EW146_g9851, partial [Bondarzewia mesenterica]